MKDQLKATVRKKDIEIKKLTDEISRLKSQSVDEKDYQMITSATERLAVTYKTFEAIATKGLGREWKREDIEVTEAAVTVSQENLFPKLERTLSTENLYSDDETGDETRHAPTV